MMSVRPRVPIPCRFSPREAVCRAKVVVLWQALPERWHRSHPLCGAVVQTISLTLTPSLAGPNKDLTHRTLLKYCVSSP